MTTIGLVANVYQEVNALPGWLETHLAFFDDVRVLHAGPGGEYSSDGTIELLEKWRVPVVFASIDEGFGTVRTRAVRMSPCDWVMVLDADERFYARHQVMDCGGVSTPPDEVNTVLQSYDFRDLKTIIPNWENIGRLGANLTVSYGGAYNQGAWLREIIEYGERDAVITVRRHWHDFSWRRPTQNWRTDPDYQMRLLRNVPGVYFDAGTRMHERVVGTCNPFKPNMEHGPFFDHFHFTFKRMEPEQRAHDIRIYDAIHEGRRPPTVKEFLS